MLEHQYIKGTEEVTLFEGVAEEGDIIQFEEPAYGLEASGFSVQSSGANYAVLSAGTGTLTGKKYVHMTRDVRVPVSEDEVSNVVEVKEATLVSLTNSAAVAQRLAGYYQYIEALDHEVVYDGERPGDVVAFEHPYGGESKGCIKDTAITMGGRLVASEQAVIGYVPPKFETEEVLDERVVLTGSGDYTVPEGVYTLTVVCIQAGTGAQAGFDGEPGGGTQLIVTTKEQDAGGSWSDTQADGGEGGQKGLQALAERSTGRRLMLSLVRSSIMSAAPQALEERRMGPWVLLVVRPRSGIYRLHRGPRLRSDTWTR